MQGPLYSVGRGDRIDNIYGNTITVRPRSGKSRRLKKIWRINRAQNRKSAPLVVNYFLDGPLKRPHKLLSNITLSIHYVTDKTSERDFEVRLVLFATPE